MGKKRALWCESTNRLQLTVAGKWRVRAILIIDRSRELCVIQTHTAMKSHLRNTKTVHSSFSTESAPSKVVIVWKSSRAVLLKTDVMRRMRNISNATSTFCVTSTV